MPDPVLPKLTIDAMPEAMRAAWQDSMKLRGDATFFEVFANHPQLYKWYTQRFYGELFHGGGLDRRTTQILRLRLSSVHGCRFCNQGNRRDAASAGISDADLDAIASGDDSALNERDRVVLALADQMQLCNPQGQLDAELHASLQRYFSVAQILEMGVIAAVLTGMAKMMFVYDLVEREASCPFGPHPDSNDDDGAAPRENCR